MPFLYHKPDSFQFQAFKVKSYANAYYKHEPHMKAYSASQVKDSLGALAERLKALKLEKGELHISRSSPLHSRPLTLKRVVQYTPNWVKNQQRMASTSNQETFRADLDGRLVIDLLRHVTASSHMPLFCDLGVLCFRMFRQISCSAKLTRFPVLLSAEAFDKNLYSK